MGKPIYKNNIQCITKDQIPTDINNGELFKGTDWRVAQSAFILGEEFFLCLLNPWFLILGLFQTNQNPARIDPTHPF